MTVGGMEIRAPDIPRLPWTAAVAALIAFAALFVSESGSLVLPFLGIALTATYLSPARLESRSGLNWMLRLLLFGGIAILHVVRPANDAMGLADPNTMSFFGEMCAAELVLQAWRRRPAGGGRGVAVIPLSGLVFLSACNTFDDRYVRLFTPAYTLFLILSLPAFRPPSAARSDSGSRRWDGLRWVALLLALGLGAGTYTAFHTYRNEMTDWGMHLLNEKQRDALDPGGVPSSPHLGRMFGAPGSTTRVLRLEGGGDFAYLRAVAFDTYTFGTWGPNRDNREYVPATPQELPTTGSGPAIRVTRLADDAGLLFAPLNTAGLTVSGNTVLEWGRTDRTPLRSPASNEDYTIFLGNEDEHQGPFCAPPDAVTRERLLVVPQEIDPRVRQLAQKIAGNLADSRLKVTAVTSYLLNNNKYSLYAHPGRGDPLSDFLLQRRAAHCEYFASAAVMLLRCVGVPSRYVTGYFAHENESAGVTVVRQRDAHAWAESWIDGFGWITVDATPGDGRPDQTAGPTPAQIKLWEWFQDRFAFLRSALTGPNGLRNAAVLCGIAVLWLLGQRLRLRRGAPARKSGPFVYASPDAEIAALSARFEAVCRRRGLVCPPGRTWQEFLAGLAAANLTEPVALNLGAATAFVRQYNALRFGVPDNREAIAALQDLLRQLESGPHK